MYSPYSYGDLDCSRMLTTLKCFTYDIGEANFLSAFVNLVSASLAVSSLVNNEWIVIDDDEINSTLIDPTADYFDFPGATKCDKLGTRDFWSLATFGGYIGKDGKQHTAFRSDGRVLWDCVTPLVANLFYMLIALCFVICLTSSSACLLHVLAPPHGFMVWLRRNTILEMCNMMLTLAACAVAVVAETAISSIRPESDVSVGPGLFLLTLSGLLSFLAALVSLRHTSRMQRVRRMDNQRLLCARSLRSWRDLTRRPEDTRPIVDFERYLDSATSLEELGGSKGGQQTCA